jgi:UDP-N-acetylmuramoyl-tripeptide--D-alanyl-D-alanine ligase
VLVLGEMRELGAVSAEEHDAIGEAAAASGASRVVAIAGDARRIAERAASRGTEAHFEDDSASAVPVVLASVEPGDLVLVKGSRGVKTERIVKALAARASGERSAS